MSWQACAWAQEVGPRWELKPLTRYVLLTLANYADKEGGSIFPSVETLCRDTGLSRNTLREHIKVLIREGLVAETGRVSVARSANYATNGYRLKMDAVPPSEPVDNRGSGADPLASQGVKRRAPGGQMTGSRGSGADPNPLKNQKEPRGGSVRAGRADCSACGRSHPVVNLEAGRCPECCASHPAAPALEPAQGVALFRQLRAQGLPE